MTRSKVVLQYIPNDSARKMTFKKRKKGLIKKLCELKTLCAIDACAIICSPYDVKPEVWPNPSGARMVLGRFNRISEDDQAKKMLDQEKYLRQRVEKAGQQLEKMRKDSKENELTKLMFDCINGRRVVDGLDLTKTKDLCGVAEKILAQIDDKIRRLNHANGGALSSSCKTVLTL